MLRGESADIKPRSHQQTISANEELIPAGSHPTRHGREPSHPVTAAIGTGRHNKQNTLDVLKNELQNEELTYHRGYTGTGEFDRYGPSGNGSSIKTPSSKKRPNTGSFNSRVPNGYKTQKIEIANMHIQH
jgi:hypothetical protein